MKLLPATALLAFCVGWGPLLLAYPQQAVAECLDNGSIPCAVHADNETLVAESLATTAATAETLDAEAGTLDTESTAPAPTAATLGLFGSALVILGVFRSKRTVHRQLY